MGQSIGSAFQDGVAETERSQDEENTAPVGGDKEVLASCLRHHRGTVRYNANHAKLDRFCTKKKKKKSGSSLRTGSISVMAARIFAFQVDDSYRGSAEDVGAGCHREIHSEASVSE